MIKVTSNIDTVIAQVKAKQKRIIRKRKEFLERLGEEGISLANVKIQQVQYDGYNDAFVEPLTWEGDKLILAVSGQNITFIEFGSGVHYSAQHPMATEMGMIRGEFGRGQGKRDVWYYQGHPGTHGEIRKVTKGGRTKIRTHGNPPNRIVYDTAQTLRERITQIAREVYSND